MGIVSGVLGRERGKVQSRIDFACYRCALPPLGLAAKLPYKGSWRDEMDFAYPVPLMRAAARRQRWSASEFDKIQVFLDTLGDSTIFWEDEIATNSQSVKSWIQELNSATASTPLPGGGMVELADVLQNYRNTKVLLNGAASVIDTPDQLSLLGRLPLFFQSILAKQNRFQDFNVAGSIGRGAIAQVPWVGVFNKKITTSAQDGYYIVLLFSEDMSGCFLSLNQGVTAFREVGIPDERDQ
jgi:hypothetical protein